MFKVLLPLLVVFATLVVSTPNNKHGIDHLWSYDYQHISRHYQPEIECEYVESTCGEFGDFGVCRTGGCLSEERVCELSKAHCPGTDCQCCKPQKKCKEEESTCGENGNTGVCRTGDCESDERLCEHSKADCPGSDCQCCKPQGGECKNEESSCGEYGDLGVCRTDGCRPNERFCDCSKAGCPGTDCQCCKPQKKCKNEESHCGEYGDLGVCRTDGCRPNERVCDRCKAGCPGTDCQCCKPQTITVPPVNECVDDWLGNDIGDCGIYKQICYERNHQHYEWVTENCKKTCGICNGVTVPPENVCVDHWHGDKQGNCGTYQNICYERNHQYYEWMAENCRKTCGVCNEDSCKSLIPPGFWIPTASSGHPTCSERDGRYTGIFKAGLQCCQPDSCKSLKPPGFWISTGFPGNPTCSKRDGRYTGIFKAGGQCCQPDTCGSMRPECVNNNGYCTPQPSSCQGKISRNACSGPNCYCCIPTRGY